MIHLTPTPHFRPRMEIAAVFIEHEDKILLLHRQKHKSQGNKWGIPGGKVHQGETPLQSVFREIREETGFDISQQLVEYLRTVYIEYNEKDHFTYHMFRTQLTEDPTSIKIHFEEHKGFTWVTPSEGLTMDLIDDEAPCFRLIYPELALCDTSAV